MWKLCFKHGTRYVRKASLTRVFDHLPCEITGTLIAHGERWHYRINAAGTASWTGDGPTRYFGCSTPVCAPLVLLMPDNGEP